MWLIELPAAASVFIKKTTQNIISGGWCMDSEDSDRPATLWQLVYLEKTQNIISSGERCLDSETTDQPVAAQNVCGS